MLKSILCFGMVPIGNKNDAVMVSYLLDIVVTHT